MMMMTRAIPDDGDEGAVTQFPPLAASSFTQSFSQNS